MMKRKAIPIALLALGMLALGTAQAEIVDDFPEVVILGQTSVQIDQNVTVFSGDVVTNNNPGGTMSLGNKVTTPAGWEVKADSLSVGNFVNLNGAEFCNFASGGVVCAPLVPTPMVYGQMPVFQPGSAGGPDVIVPNSGSTVLTPNDYGALTVGVEGTVTFQGPGDFNFTSFTAGRKGQFIFTGGPIEIRVSGNFSTGVEDNINLANSPVDASDVAIYVGGNAELGDKTNVNANFYVLGLLEFGSNVIAQGAYLAGQVVVGQKSKFTLSTFWDYQPCQTEPPGACDDSATTDEDNAVTIDVLANDTDFEGDDLFVNSVEGVTQAQHGTVTFTAGDVTYTPNADYFGPDSFTYEVCDVDTKTNEDNCVDIDVTVTVTSVNDPPVPGDDIATTSEDPDDPVVIDVLANDKVGPPGPPEEGGSLSINGVSDPPNGRAVVTTDQKIAYTPDQDFFGEDVFTYTVCDDGDGFDDPDAVRCSTGTVTVTVTPVPDPPIADPQDVTTSGSADLIITLTGSDADGDLLIFSITVQPDPAKGSIVAGPTPATPTTSASVTYRPVTADNRLDSFEFQVDDGTGLTDTAIVTINPSEACVDDTDCPAGFVCNTDAPDPADYFCEAADPTTILANDEELETGTGVDVEITVSASAPAGVDDLVFEIISGPTSGSLDPAQFPTPIDPVTTPIRSATTTYSPSCTPTDPPEAPVCTASFVFEACEAANTSNCGTATVTINVSDAAAAAPPVATDITTTTGVNQPVVIDLTGGAGQTCTTDGDCTVGEICLVPAGESVGSCVPDTARICTDDDDCAPGFTCVGGACVE